MILYDTGAIVAAANTNDQHHHSCVTLLTGLRLSNGDFEPVEITVADYARMTDLAETYIERPLGVTDASVIAIAERLGITEIACTDRTDCRMVHSQHVDASTLLPEGIG